MRKAGRADTGKAHRRLPRPGGGTRRSADSYRAEDHQSTMGAFVGKTRNDGGKGVMVDFRYADGASSSRPTPKEVESEARGAAPCARRTDTAAASAQ